jgi:hypothetical protein
MTRIATGRPGHRNPPENAVAFAEQWRSRGARCAGNVGGTIDRRDAKHGERRCGAAARGPY